MASKRRIYEELRALVEREGGEMHFERKGFSVGGAWIVTLKGVTKHFPSNGSGFPELDRLYVPDVPDPKHWSDYSKDLHADSPREWLHLFKDVAAKRFR